MGSGSSSGTDTVVPNTAAESMLPPADEPSEDDKDSSAPEKVQPPPDDADEAEVEALAPNAAAESTEPPPDVEAEAEAVALAPNAAAESTEPPPDDADGAVNDLESKQPTRAEIKARQSQILTPRLFLKWLASKNWVWDVF